MCEVVLRGIEEIHGDGKSRGLDFGGQHVVQTYDRCLGSTITVHSNRSSLPPYLRIQNRDMCHSMIGSSLVDIEPLIKIKSQPDQNYNIL